MNEQVERMATFYFGGDFKPMAETRDVANFHVCSLTAMTRAEWLVFARDRLTDAAHAQLGVVFDPTLWELEYTMPMADELQNGWGFSVSDIKHGGRMAMICLVVVMEKIFSREQLWSFERSVQRLFGPPPLVEREAEAILQSLDF